MEKITRDFVCMTEERLSIWNCWKDKYPVTFGTETHKHDHNQTSTYTKPVIT